MVCSIPRRKFSEFSSSLEKITMLKRIPYMGALELTYRCNHTCRHCYCNLSVNDEKKSEELTFQEIKKILDDMAEAGCLWLLFTGGEVLIREDFRDIYLYAVKKGMFVEIFTNATLITDEIAKEFAETPPLGIEISIYGSCASVHDNVTRVKGSFGRVMSGIDFLKKHNVPFSLKSMLLTLNKEDLNNMKFLAKDLKAEFKFDCFICPRLDGRGNPIDYRLAVSDIVDLELQNEQDLLTYKEIFKEFWKKELTDTFICSAGINSFNISPYGILSPCTMFLSFQYSARQKSFKSAWDNLIKDYENGPNDFLSSECKSCSMVSICPSCPAWSELEVKKINKKVDYLCNYALLLEKKFLEKKENENAKKALQETED